MQVSIILRQTFVGNQESRKNVVGSSLLFSLDVDRENFQQRVKLFGSTRVNETLHYINKKKMFKKV